MLDWQSDILEPVDLRKVWWREYDPLPRQPMIPLDWERIRADAEMVTDTKYLYGMRWHKVSLSPWMTRAEAHFWIIQMLNPTILEEELDFDPAHYSGDLKFSDIQNDFSAIYHHIPAEIVIPLHVLFDVPEYMPTLITFATYYYAAQWAETWLPYVSHEEIETIRQLVRPHLNSAIPQIPLPRTGGASFTMPSKIMWAINCGLGDELQFQVSQWQDGQFTDRRGRMKLLKGNRYADVMMTLPSVENVVYEIKRTQLALCEPYQIRWWLAHTGTDYLDYVRDSIAIEKGKVRARRLMQVLGAIETPEVASYMFELLSQNVGSSYATQWLDKHSQLAAEALVPFAQAQGKQGDLARNYLKVMIRDGQEDIVRQFADDGLMEKLIDRTVTIDAPLFDETTTPEWLHHHIQVINTDKSVKSPRWVSPSTLPPIVVDGFQLTDKQIDAILRTLKAAQNKPAQPMLADMKLYSDRHLLDNFVWSLMEQWQRNGERNQDVWAFLSPIRLGTDKLLPRFVPLLKEMASRKKSKKTTKRMVITALNELATLATDTAYVQLVALRDALHARHMIHHLDEAVKQLAEHRKLSIEDLQDRAIPDCGLDETGSRVFDYGRRQFTVLIGSDLTPMIRDEAGKIRKNLPKPGKLDDNVVAEPAYESWKFIKKQIRQTITAQTPRLEQAMLHERRWTIENFEMHFLKHPIMRYLARQIIWGSYANSAILEDNPALDKLNGRVSNESLVCSFRINHDGLFVDCHDRPINIDPTYAIGIVHPIHLNTETIQQWQEVLLDFEIIQLFHQINRPVYHVEPEAVQNGVLDVEQFTDKQLHVLGVRTTMFKAGYQEFGWYSSFGKRFPQYNLTVLLRLHHTNNQSARFDSAKYISAINFARGEVPRGYGEKYQAVDLKDIPPLVVSEAIYDLKVTFK